ncbi:preprotein translocase subunit [Thermoanaerobacterium thermosaccharolyticum]|uniref:Preprotein translocase subunit n=1 Tax=Thermoanaerobacterium thermosaccharolyticum TaxID=1517 RepID=A0A223HWD9_THETR|nr:preprotein translocase subunit [Thermoanaerobacterium thermosaccharolyticum]
MLDFIAVPIGYLLKFIYEVLAFKNYGLAIIFLTIIVKTM